jgi:hypothetical protein
MSIPSSVHYPLCYPQRLPAGLPNSRLWALAPLLAWTTQTRGRAERRGRRTRGEPQHCRLTLTSSHLTPLTRALSSLRSWGRTICSSSRTSILALSPSLHGCTATSPGRCLLTHIPPCAFVIALSNVPSLPCSKLPHHREPLEDAENGLYAYGDGDVYKDADWDDALTRTYIPIPPSMRSAASFALAVLSPSVGSIALHNAPDQSGETSFLRPTESLSWDRMSTIRAQSRRSSRCHRLRRRASQTCRHHRALGARRRPCWGGCYLCSCTWDLIVVSFLSTAHIDY